MFKKSKTIQPELFSGIINLVGKKKGDLLESPQSMHNIFYKEVVSRIDESIFSVLFDKENGRPNASLRILVGMMILKEGEGWTDEQLFNACQFDLRMMISLGLNNISDQVPAPSTYYKFKYLVEEYDKANNINLLHKCFESLTIDQMEYHCVSGKQIRLDSKLIQSNIAKNSRLGLLLEGLRVHVSSDLPSWHMRVTFSEEELLLLESLETKMPHRILYDMLDREQQEMLSMVGYLYQKLASQSSEGSVLYRLYHEQFKEEVSQEVKEDDHQDNDQGGINEPPTIVTAKSDKELKSDNIQSIHDTDASYRKKNNQKIHGYHVQITETCSEENELNLILDVTTCGAHKSECEFLQPTVNQVNQMIAHKNGNEHVEEVIADGGYDSVENRAWANTDEQSAEIILTKTKGKEQSYEMSFDHEGYLIVKDKESKKECEVYYSKGENEKIVIKNEDGLKRYFTWGQITNYMLIQLMSSKVTADHHNIRANVESTVHQVFCKLERRYKTRYRGKIRTHFYVVSRAMWANFQRIGKKIAQIDSFFEYLAKRVYMAVHSMKIFLLNFNYIYPKNIFYR